MPYCPLYSYNKVEISLTVNGIWGGWGWFPPPCYNILFREKNRHSICIWFFDLGTKILLANLKKINGSSGPRELSRDLLSTGGERKLSVFEVLEHISEFSKFSREIYLLSRSYRALAENIKNLLISALVSVETRLKFPTFAIFGIFQALRFSTSLWPRTMLFLQKFSPINVLLRAIKDFFITLTI